MRMSESTQPLCSRRLQWNLGIGFLTVLQKQEEQYLTRQSSRRDESSERLSFHLFCYSETLTSRVHAGQGSPTLLKPAALRSTSGSSSPHKPVRPNESDQLFFRVETLGAKARESGLSPPSSVHFDIYNRCARIHRLASEPRSIRDHCLPVCDRGFCDRS
jgi:hypothetical protein